MIRVLYVENGVSPFEPVRMLLELASDMKVDVAASVEDCCGRKGEADVVVFGKKGVAQECIARFASFRSSGDMTPFVMLADRLDEGTREEASRLGNSAYIHLEGDTTKDLLLLIDTIKRLAGECA